MTIRGRGASRPARPPGGELGGRSRCPRAARRSVADLHRRHLRLFARNTGDPKSTLKVEVLYLDAKGKLKIRASGNYKAASAEWAPTGTMKIDLAFEPTSVGGAAPVALRFTPQGKGE